MKKIKVSIKENGSSMGEGFFVAEKFFDRLKGLMFEKEIKGYDGLLIKNCNSIHTFFMNFNIDVVFLNKNFEVIKILRDLRKWRITPIYFKASQVLEMKSGGLPEGLKEGETLEVQCIK